MLTAAGNINEPYTALGIVHAVVTRPAKSAGCSGPGGLPIQEAYEAVLSALVVSAERSGGDALIHVNYDYRLSATTAGCGSNKAVFEVYGWGTAIRLQRHP